MGEQHIFEKKNLYEIVSSFETFLKETLSTAGQEKSRLTPTCTYMDDMQERCFSLLKLDLNIKKKKKKKKKKDNQNEQKMAGKCFF